MIDNFFFGRIDLRVYAVLRVAFGILLCFTLLIFYQEIDFNFSANGWKSFDPDGLFGMLSPSVLNFINEPENVRIFFIFMILLSFLVTFGIMTRVALFTVIIGLIFIKDRNLIVWHVSDYMVNLMLIYLLFSPCEKAWSVGSFLSRKPPQSTGPVFILRLIQIHIALIYLINGFAKSLDNNWLDGYAAILAASHPFYNRWDLSIILQNQFFFSLVKFLTIAVVFWELFYPVFFLNKYTKFISLSFGVCFNLGIIIGIRLELIGYVMLAASLAFISPFYLQKIESAFKAVFNFLSKNNLPDK